MKNIFLIITALMLFPVTTHAGKNTASNFINGLKSAADSDGQMSHTQVDISCPVKSASGMLMITKADYEFGKSRGGYVFNDDDSVARLNLFFINYKNLSSKEVVGATFIFKVNRGQFFIDLMKSGKVRAGVNVGGKSGIDWIDCKILPRD